MPRMIIVGKDGNGSRMTALVQTATADKVGAAQMDGAEIIINTNWRFHGRGYSKVVKLSQTNHRKGGKPKHIIWACYL